MDIRALSQLTGAGNGSSVAASVPADTRALLSEIAANTALSDSEKGSLIAATASIDSGLSGMVRSNALAQVQGLGIYLKNTNSEGFPRWPMMTALRAYGMNLSANSGQSAVISNLKGQLEQIAQGRGVTLEKALAAAASLPVAKPPVPQAEIQVTEPATDVGKLVEAIA